MINEKQRKYFRLTYPHVQRPVLAMEFDQYEVEDISELGIKIKTDNDDLTFAIDDHVMATLVLPGGREFDIDGRVIRVQDGSVGVELDTPLPDSLIRSEAIQVLYSLPDEN